MINRRNFIKGLAALAVMPKQLLEGTVQEEEASQHCALVECECGVVYERQPLYDNLGERVCITRVGIDGAEVKLLWPGVDLADYYLPGTVVWVTMDMGDIWHKKIIQSRGHRWKRGKR